MKIGNWELAKQGIGNWANREWGIGQTGNWALAKQGILPDRDLSAGEAEASRSKSKGRHWSNYFDSSFFLMTNNQ
ncbi:hypothetical protein IQ269_07740 [Tychonema sp. LEGE 07199]|uniref:hypothetical protein n=1 Tax=unclassified Tychonema TaxID=2642144 RepID=UPI0018804A4B|nr:MULTISPECIES: hypothetical protein [unclassified Tychonema]MBE9120711.1 hypothetical protein [Tychonema sp. LEGE 07199]MBE9133101.1 hypothetical protein [Tychonema sp. LEGE 07196]